MPSISVIVPCFNEGRTITQLLVAIANQNFPRPDLEIIIADGHSTDSTRQHISEFQASHPDLAIKVIDNPKRLIPAGLNLAIAAAQGATIVRLDAHCVPQADYLSRVLKALDAGLGSNVGGVWAIPGGARGCIAASIAIAASHPLGVGDAYYRYTKQAREADTVPFGAFRKALVSTLGGFDESLHSNEDYEFNARIRQEGGKIWLDPEIKSIYFARSTLSALARQYARYGYWKVRMLRHYPGSLRLRQVLPPLFVLSLITLALAGLNWPWLHWVLIFEVVSYLVLLLGAAVLKTLEFKQIKFLFGIPLAIATMHLSWGAAFLWSLINPSVRKV
ncbi:MAG: glycosyltransferase family 2 protein [Anaerolineales bacterium]